MIYAYETFGILGALFIVLYIYLTQNFEYWKSRKIPHKKPIILFGNLFDVVVKGKPIADYLAKLYQEYEGPYFGFFGMIEPFLVIKDTAIIKRILVTDFNAFDEKTFINNERIDPIFSNVLFTLKKRRWAELRSKLTPLFTSGKLKGMFPLIKGNAEDMCKYLNVRLNRQMDVKELAAKFSTDVIANCAFGIQINAFLQEKCEFREAGKKQFAIKFSRAMQPLAYIFAHPLVKLLRLKFIQTEAANYFRNIFSKTIAEREKTNLQRGDLINALLFLKNNNNDENTEFKFYGDRLVAQAIIVYVAGNEGISNAIAFTLLELSVYPSIQQKLRKEIQMSISSHGDLTYAAIQDMKYLHMVISETFRKYPFTAFIHRRCTQTYTIPETGFVIPPGLKILIPLQGIHWDPKYYPSPEEYDPERFNEDNKSKRPEFSYIPFGYGPRSCIGNRFALLVIQLALINIMLNYEVEKGANMKYPLQFGVSFFLHPLDGIRLIFKKL